MNTEMSTGTIYSEGEKRPGANRLLKQLQRSGIAAVSTATEELAAFHTGVIHPDYEVAGTMRFVFNYNDASLISRRIKEIFSSEDIVRNLNAAGFTGSQIAAAMFNEVSRDTIEMAKILKDVLNIAGAGELAALLNGAGFQDAQKAVDTLFDHNRQLNAAECPADCPVHCVADCPAHCVVHCPADCPTHCIANCAAHCPVHCVADCPAHCITHL